MCLFLEKIEREKELGKLEIGNWRPETGKRRDRKRRRKMKKKKKKREKGDDDEQ